MRAPLTNCPDCNSKQRFSPKRRISAEDHEIVEFYIECFACGYESVVESMRRAEELARKRDRVRRNRLIRRQIRSS